MKEQTTLLITGDIGFDKYMDGKWNDPDLLSDEVLSYLRDTDHLIVNVEGPLSEQKKQVSAVPSLVHAMNPEAAVFLKKIGADVWNLCNNHIMDAGPDGLRDTLDLAAQYGAQTIGAGMDITAAMQPLVFDEAGGIGMISVGYQRACRKAGEDTPGCFGWSDMDLIAQAIGEIKKTCRYCIVVAHGGEEFTALPSPYTRDRYIAYLDMGADIVVSHHPHVPLNYETFPDNKVIFYSLGNFVFDTDYQRSQFHTEEGLFLKLVFTDEGYTFEPYGIRIDRTCDHVVAGPLPKIFTDIQKEEYEKLIPLACKMFLENTKRQLRFLKPAEFAHATEEDFYRNFYEPLRSGRVPGEVLDFQIIWPLAQQAEEQAWKESSLTEVRDYILEQIYPDGIPEDFT